MNILEKLYEMKNNHEYDMEKLSDVADTIEEMIGAAECWNTLRLGFSSDEFLENLMYIAKENDL